VKPVLLIAMLLVCSAASAKPRGVTLDVKDADVHVVLKSIQKQCGIKNLVIDPGVTGSGTFLFHNVPCNVALDTVLRVNGLAAKTYSSSVVAVAPR
jgi:type II secretory pathway component GspD/PulD (secretin)